MVKKASLCNKNAFTMIELIFAIVIIAISVFALPMMTQTTSKGIKNNIIQEAIFATSALLNESTSYYWDKHSIDDINISGGYSRVINTGDCSNSLPHKRQGHINRQCLDNNATIPFNGVDDKSIEWVENIYNNQPILEGTGTNKAGYKDNYFAKADVKPCGSGGCVQFGSEINNPNLKEITLTISDSTSSAVVLLRTYVANIGEVKVESRFLP